MRTVMLLLRETIFYIYVFVSRTTDLILQLYLVDSSPKYIIKFFFIIMCKDLNYIGHAFETLPIKDGEFGTNVAD